MSQKELIARDGWAIIGFFAVLTVITYLMDFIIMSWVFLVLTAFCIYFFRNPNRAELEEEGIVVAPADGRVKSIARVYEERFIKGEAIRISIFLSLFNVHINRVPITGTVIYTEKQGMNFRPAYRVNARDTNVSNYIGLDTEYGKVLVVQITGLVARRIVSWVNEGDLVYTGKHLGLIRFGSCTEIYLPVDAEILVEVGQSIRGGETIIAKFNN